MKRPSRPRGAPGFTLLELIVTVAIIAVLAAMAIPTYNRFVRKAKEVEGEIAVRRVETLETEFYTDHGVYSDDPVAIGYPDLPARKFYDLAIALGAGPEDFRYQAKAFPKPDIGEELDTWYLTKNADGSTDMVHSFLAAGSPPGSSPPPGGSSPGGSSPSPLPAPPPSPPPGNDDDDDDDDD